MKSLILRISYLERIFLSSLRDGKRKKENARRTISSTKRVSEGAFVLTVRPSVRPFGRPSVRESNATLDGSPARVDSNALER